MTAQSPSGQKSVFPSAKLSQQVSLCGVLGKFLNKVFALFPRPKLKFMVEPSSTNVTAAWPSPAGRVGARRPPTLELRRDPEHGVLVLVRREVLAERLKTLTQRLGKEPQFASYAIADGSRRAFTRLGKWRRKILDPEPEPSGNELLGLRPRFRELFATDTR